MKASVSLTSLSLHSSPNNSTASSMMDVSDETNLKEQSVNLRHLSVAAKTNNWRRSWESADIWNVIQPNYNYLMDNELITTCKEAKGDLCESSGDESYKGMQCKWSYREFLNEYEELVSWLSNAEKLQKELPPTQLDELDIELQSLSERRLNFIEQAKCLHQKHPSMKDDICLKVHDLNNRWNILEHAVTPKKDSEESTGLRKDIAQKFQYLRKFLRDCEHKLQSIEIQPGLTLEEIIEILHILKGIQESLSQHNSVFYAARELLSRLTFPEACEKQQVKQGRARPLQPVFDNLLKHYHKLRLKTVEIQCLLEGQDHSLSSGSLDLSVCDEPLRKFPRLGDHLYDKSATTTLPHAEQEWNALQKVENLQQQSVNAEDGHHGQNTSPDITSSLFPDESEKGVTKLEKGYSYEGRGRSRKKWKKDASTECRPGLGVHSKGVMVGSTGIGILKTSGIGENNMDMDVERGEVDAEENFEMGEHRELDVGYSSESSAHFSNDERGGESLRVYTYLSSDKTNPRILDEVVLDDGLKHKNRKRNGEYTSLDLGSDSDDVDSPTLREGYLANSEQTTPNCATFHFIHEDTDPEELLESRNKPIVPKRSLWRSDSLQQEEDSWSFSESENQLTDLVEYSQNDYSTTIEWENEMEEMLKASDSEIFTDAENGMSTTKNVEIKQLVERVEMLVRNRNSSVPSKFHLPLSPDLAVMHTNEWASAAVGPPMRRSVDSSCDASGESTSSDADESKDEDLSGSETNRGLESALGPLAMSYPSNLVRETVSTPEFAEAAAKMMTSKICCTSENEIPLASGVAMRTKAKKRSGDRPWSVVEPDEGSWNLQHDKMTQMSSSVSEGALDRLSTGIVTNTSFRTNPYRQYSEDVFMPGKLGSPLSSSTSTNSSHRRRRRRKGMRNSDSGSDGSGGIGLVTQSSPRHLSRSTTDTSRSQSRSRLIDLSTTATSTDSEAENSVIVDLPNRGPGSTGVSRRIESDGHLSSHSEQAWDDYQAPPYVIGQYPEAYDDENARQLLDCDDYRVHIESQSDGTSTPSCHARREDGSFLIGKYGANDGSTKKSQGLVKVPSRDADLLDSDSDADELHHFVLLTSQNLQVTREKLRVKQKKDLSDPANFCNYNEILATCCTYLECLRKTYTCLAARPTGNFDKVVNRLSEAFEAWQELHKQATMEYQNVQKIMGFKKELGTLSAALDEAMTSATSYSNSASNEDEVKEAISYLKEQLNVHDDRKKKLKMLNVEVNTFVNETGVDPDMLKKEVNNVYKRMDEAYKCMSELLKQFEQIEPILSDFQKIDHSLQTKEKELLVLQEIFENIPKGLNFEKKLLAKVKDIPNNKELLTSLNTYGIYVGIEASVSDNSSMSIQDQLSAFAKLLMGSLGNTDLFGKLKKQLNHLQKKASSLEDYEKTVFMDISEKKNQSTRTYPKTESHFARRRRTSVTGLSQPKPKCSMFWRVIRAAVPIQFAVVILFCIAYLMEPHCCDSVNNFSMSLTPQLRYVRGPPPI